MAELSVLPCLVDSSVRPQEGHRRTRHPWSSACGWLFFAIDSRCEQTLAPSLFLGLSFCLCSSLDRLGQHQSFRPLKPVRRKGEYGGLG